MSIAPTEAPIAILNATHRCDRCSSRAYVLVLLKYSPGLPASGELTFCCHHFAAFEEALQPYTSQVIDERWQIAGHIADDGHIN